jgi:hypothetical protein
MRSQTPGLNSIAWNLWHISRAEDVGINRLVADRGQVLDDEGWLARLGIDIRHQGTGQTAEEATATTTCLNLEALRAYTTAVEHRTLAVVESLEPDLLDDTLDPGRTHQVLFDEGFAHSNGAWLEKAYMGWHLGKCLIHFSLTHSYQHVGEIGVLASLQGRCLRAVKTTARRGSPKRAAHLLRAIAWRVGSPPVGPPYSGPSRPLADQSQREPGLGAQNDTVGIVPSVLRRRFEHAPVGAAEASRPGRSKMLLICSS